MSNLTRLTRADLEADIDASEAEIGPGVPFAEMESKIEAAIERAVHGSQKPPSDPRSRVTYRS